MWFSMGSSIKFNPLLLDYKPAYTLEHCNYFATMSLCVRMLYTARLPWQPVLAPPSWQNNKPQLAWVRTFISTMLLFSQKFRTYYVMACTSVRIPGISSVNTQFYLYVWYSCYFISLLASSRNVLMAAKNSCSIIETVYVCMTVLTVIYPG